MEGPPWKLAKQKSFLRTCICCIQFSHSTGQAQAFISARPRKRENIDPGAYACVLSVFLFVTMKLELLCL